MHPKLEFDSGQSCYFLKEGYKVSRFLRGDELVYWYCDIIDYEYIKDEDTYIFRDLLADVVVYPNGFVKVLDLDEFEEALEAGSLTSQDVRKALRALSKLLNIIYNGKFEILTKEILSRVTNEQGDKASPYSHLLKGFFAPLNYEKPCIKNTVFSDSIFYFSFHNDPYVQYGQHGYDGNDG